MRCVVWPTPAEENDSLPGACRAALSRSSSERTGDAWGTTSTLENEIMSVSATKSSGL